MKFQRQIWLGLVLLAGLGALVYATNPLSKGDSAEVKPAPEVKAEFKLYFPGELVVKKLDENRWKHLSARIPRLEKKLQFGPNHIYTLLSFDRDFPVSQAVLELDGACRWAEPHFRTGLLQDKKDKKGKKDSDKSGKKGKKGKKKKKSQALRPPRDSHFRKQWAADNFGQDAPRGIVGKIGADISLLKAWTVAKGSKKIIVAVLDTGVDYNHPDLEENMWTNEKEKYGIPNYDDDGNGFVDDVHGWNFVSSDKTGNQAGKPDCMDDNGHGTHCAGVIGARVDNLKGVAGINWNVSIMGVKFLNAMGSGGSVGVFRGMKYAADNGAQVISCSFGSTSESKLEKDAVKYALAKGVLVVAAAGNDGVSNDRAKHFPSNYKFDNVVSVAATNNIDKLASFSCFGANTVHLAAPGVSIVSTLPGNRYGSASGTSMAAPHVSGAAALLLSTDESLKVKEIRRRLMDTTDPIIDLVGRVKSWGRLNLYNLLTNKKPARPSFDESKIKEEDKKIESIRYPTQRIDYVYKIVKPGAHYMRVHFKLILTDPNWDYVEILDKDNRKVDSITQYLSNEWSAWVKGDTIKIRLYAEPPMTMETRRVGNVNFITLAQGKASKTWGFTIDKIGYIPGEKSDGKKSDNKKSDDKK